MRRGGGVRPAQAPPELVSRRLRSRTWRVANSWWLAVPAVGLPWVSFLYMGLRAGRPGWVVAAVAYFVSTGAALGLIGQGGWEIVLGLFLLLGTWGTGVVHSVMANSRWLRIKAAWNGEALPAAEPPAPAPDPVLEPVAALGHRLAEVVALAHRHGDRLPDGAVPTVREIDDVLRPLLGYVDRRGADVAEVHNLEAIVQEYLPGALEKYLDLPEEYALTHRGSGGATPAEELLNQLRLLLDGARQLQQAVYDHDAQQLAVQGRFLDTKFRRSDLDL